MFIERVISYVKKEAILTVILFTGFGTTAIAQPDFGGFLEIDKRFVTGGDSTYIDNFYNQFRLEMKAGFTPCSTIAR